MSPETVAPSRYRGAIFDVDGVLVDTARYHYLAWQRLAKELGFDLSLEDNELLKGVSRMHSLDILLSLGGLTCDGPTRSRLAKRKNSWYVAYIHRMDATEVLSGSRELLAELKELGVPLAVGSASSHAREILALVGLDSYFDAIVDAGAITRAKPNPEIFLVAAAALGLRPDECVVFEDAAVGVQAAKAAGMLAVGIGRASVLYEADLTVPSLAAPGLASLFQAPGPGPVVPHNWPDEGGLATVAVDAANESRRRAG